MSPPRTKIFIDEDERTSVLIGGAVEDIEFANEAAANLWKVQIDAVAIPKPGSVWKRTPQDLEIYGIVADNTTYMEHFVFIPSRGIQELLPDVGQPAMMYFKVRSELRKLPGLGLSAYKHPQFGDPFPAKRLALPSGIHADVAYFAVYTPRQSHWFPGFQRPPVKYYIPTTEITGSLQKFAESLFNKEDSQSNKNNVSQNGKQNRNMQPGKTDKPKPGEGNNTEEPLRVKIRYYPNTTTAKAECAAITGINLFSSTHDKAANWWSYIRDFRQFPESDHRNLLEAFPGVAELIERHEFKGGHRQAAESLTKTKAGRVFVAGGPGTGKFTFCGKIVKGVIARPPGNGWKNESALVAESKIQQNEPTLEAINQETAGLIQSLDDEQQGDFWGPTSQDREKVIELQTIRREFEQEQTTRLATDSTELSVDGISEQAESDVTGDDVQDSSGRDEETGPVSAEDTDTITATGRVVWMALSNRRVADAMDRLGADSPDKILTHVYPFVKEMQNVFDREPMRPGEPQFDRLMTAAENILIKSQYENRLEAFETTSPGADSRSLSERAKRLILDQPEKYAIMRQAMNDKKHHKDDFLDNLVQYREAAREVLLDAAKDTDVILGTPVAIQQFANHIAD